MISSLSRSCASSFARGSLPLLGQSVQKRNFFRIVDQYEKGVTFTLGKLTAVKDPGIRLKIPFIQQMWKADMRTTLNRLDRQEIVTRDNVAIKVDGVVQFRVIDPRKAICNVSGVGSFEKDSSGEGYHRVGVEKAINELAQLKIREVLSHSDVNEILRNREDLGNKLTEGTNALVDDWGVEIHSIRIKDINFDESMTRAMAKTAEAHRVAEAKIINAQADIETAKKYEEAAEIYGKNPTAMRLRELEAFTRLASEKSNCTILIPTQILDVIDALKR
jgi:regulator of protease activity HflC (stomatin/prohibitin superfamily)